MPRPSVQPGERFGRLTVVEFAYSKPTKTGSRRYYLCRCDCGGTKTTHTADLRAGKTASCGCLAHETVMCQRRALSVKPGERYGRLVVGEFSHRDDRSAAYWFTCECDCGTVGQFKGESLKGGRTRSCGCLAREARSRLNRERSVRPGERYGRLVVVRVDYPADLAVATCECDCGASTKVAGRALKTGDTQSCGCLQREVTSARARTHGMTGTPTYGSWLSMIRRCTSPQAWQWEHYGGAGVRVCDRWNPAAGGSFENFLADMGERPAGTTLGRFGDVGDYEPGNCAWQTAAEQAAEQAKKRAARR